MRAKTEKAERNRHRVRKPQPGSQLWLAILEIVRRCREYDQVLIDSVTVDGDDSMVDELDAPHLREARHYLALERRVERRLRHAVR